jgi:hypothetical protein
MFKNLTEIFTDLADPVIDKGRYLKATLPNIMEVIYQNSTQAQGPWVAGGMGRQLAVDSTCRQFADIDVWFSSPKSFEHCMLRLNNSFGNTMYETFSSDNAKTYQIGDHKVQLIRRDYYDNLNAVFKQFDFTCCQVAVDKNFYIHGPGIKDARAFKLKVNRLDKRGFLARYAKYVGYGYVMPNDEFLDIINNEEINYEFDATTLGY